MTYHNAVKYILNAPDRNGAAENFDRISALSRILGSPDRNIRYIRFAGSNGKSVCQAMLAEILKESNIMVGTLTMPVTDDPRENILIGTNPLSIENTVRYVEAITGAVACLKSQIENGNDEELPLLPDNLISKKIDITPTKNEIILLMALLAFKDAKCKISLMECDHNGTDPSRFLSPPQCTVICGTIPDEDKQEIQRIKSYIRQGTSEILSAPQNSNAYKIISSACADINCRFSIPVRSSLQIEHLSLKGSDFSYREKTYSVGLCGRFQAYNASVVIEAVNMLNRSGFDVGYDAVCNGLLKVSIKSKFETLSILPTIIADSTHKIEAVSTMVDTLNDFKEQIGKDMVLCISQDIPLVNAYLDNLSQNGYNVKELIILPTKEERDIDISDIGISVSFPKTYKVAAKRVVEASNKLGFAMITGDAASTGKVRTEVLRILEY